MRKTAMVARAEETARVVAAAAGLKPSQVQGLALLFRLFAERELTIRRQGPRIGRSNRVKASAANV